MRTRAKVDSNQASMVKHLRECGLHVYLTHQVGGGFPDLITVGRHADWGDGVVAFVEVKTEKGKLTPEQEEWHDKFTERWTEHGPLIVAKDSTDVLKWYGLV